MLNIFSDFEGNVIDYALVCDESVGMNLSRFELMVIWYVMTLMWCHCYGIQFRPHTQYHYNDIIMGAIVSQITSLTIVYSTVYSDADQRKHQSSASLAFLGGIHLGPVNSPHKWPVTRKMFLFDDVIMCL